jgi:uncharacterized membrane protein YfcA
LLGQKLANVASVPGEVVYWGAAALAGGWIGAELGSRHLNTTWFRRLLSFVLLIAAIKFVFQKDPPKTAAIDQATISPKMSARGADILR